VEPFLTALLGVLILSQGLSPTTLLGGALIGTAVWILQGVGRQPAVAVEPG
jgi:drug/metabolite transporter (DMT)-like permease